MTAAEFEILSGKTPMMLGRKVVKRLQQGWELHGNTWSSAPVPTGDGIMPEFYQAVIKKPVVIKKE